MLSYPVTRFNAFKTTPIQLLYLHSIINNIGSSLTQFPIILLPVKTPPFTINSLQVIVWSHVVTIYDWYLGNYKGWRLFEVWHCINLLLYELNRRIAHKLNLSISDTSVKSDDQVKYLTPIWTGNRTYTNWVGRFQEVSEYYLKLDIM